MNYFAGGPKINEIYPESIEKSKDYLQNLDGKPIELNGGGLYKPFDPKNIENGNGTKNIGIEENNIEKNKINISEKLENSAYFPIVKNLYNSKEINEENFYELVEILENTELNEQKNTIIQFVENNINNKNNINKIKNYFNQEKNINEKNFEQSEFSKIAKLSNINIDLPGDLEIMLAENYIDLGSKNTDKKENINTTINITLNKLINKQSKDFINNNINLINDIKDQTNLETKYKKLKELYKNYLIEDAKFGGKKAKEQINKKKKLIEEKTKNIKKQLQNQIKNQEINQQEANEKWKEIKKKLQKEWIENNNLEKEIQKIEGMLKSGKLDKNQESTETKE